MTIKLASRYAVLFPAIALSLSTLPGLPEVASRSLSSEAAQGTDTSVQNMGTSTQGTAPTNQATTYNDGFLNSSVPTPACDVQSSLSASSSGNCDFGPSVYSSTAGNFAVNGHATATFKTCNHRNPDGTVTAIDGMSVTMVTTVTTIAGVGTVTSPEMCYLKSGWTSANKILSNLFATQSVTTSNKVHTLYCETAKNDTWVVDPTCQTTTVVGLSDSGALAYYNRLMKPQIDAKLQSMNPADRQSGAADLAAITATNTKSPALKDAVDNTKFLGQAAGSYVAMQTNLAQSSSNNQATISRQLSDFRTGLGTAYRARVAAIESHSTSYANSNSYNQLNADLANYNALVNQAIDAMQAKYLPADTTSAGANTGTLPGTNTGATTGADNGAGRVGGRVAGAGTIFQIPKVVVPNRTTTVKIH